MLLLGRKQEESIMLDTSDGTIEVKVCGFQITNGVPNVKIGIAAPKSINIARKELTYEKADDWGNK